MANDTTDKAHNPLYIERSLDLPRLLEKKILLSLRPAPNRQKLSDCPLTSRRYDCTICWIPRCTSPSAENPGRIAQELTADDRVVVIDEIQRLPELLNEVQRLIEHRRIHFLLTGSSARKLAPGRR